MDPLSISAGCASLIITITKISISISSFVKSTRAARGDLNTLSSELGSVKSLLECLEEDAKLEYFPAQLGTQISGIVQNCSNVLQEIENLLLKYDGSGAMKTAKWTINGSDEAQKLRLNLHYHKSALGIVLEMVSLFATRDIKHETTAIKQDTSQILTEIAHLKSQLPQNADHFVEELGSDTPNLLLDRYLDGLTTYAETVVGDLDHDQFIDDLDTQSQNSEQNQQEPDKDQKRTGDDLKHRQAISGSSNDSELTPKPSQDEHIYTSANAASMTHLLTSDLRTSKSLPEIRAEIIRVLKTLRGIRYDETKAGFTCDYHESYSHMFYFKILIVKLPFSTRHGIQIGLDRNDRVTSYARADYPRIKQDILDRLDL